MVSCEMMIKWSGLVLMYVLAADTSINFVSYLFTKHLSCCCFIADD